MQNFQFDLTNLNLFQTFDHEQFMTYCSKNGKQSNHQLIINEKLATIIQTASRVKKQHNSGQEEPRVFQQSKKDKLCPTWAFSEYKFFTYVVYLYSYIRRLELADLTSEDLHTLNQYFPDKPYTFISFQYQHLQKIKKEKWSNIEDELLVETIKRFTPKGQKISWKIIAYQIYLTSQMKIFRTYKECRERWSNHLNPTVNRKQWTLEEDKKLFQLINKEGKRWSKLVQKMNSTRTQHMIKNRYNSYLRKWRKVVPNKREQYYLEEIMNYLSAQEQKEQLDCFQPINDKQVSFQQKKSKGAKKSGDKKRSKRVKSESQSDLSVKDQHSVDIKMEIQDQIIQPLKNNIEQQSQVKHQEAQIQHYNYFDSMIKAQNEVIQKAEYIPEYMVMLQGRNEVKLGESLPENRPQYIKIVDDTWLSELQQKQNMKWLQWLQQ